jgi:hypothetical protein
MTTMGSRVSGSLDQNEGERGLSDKGETRGWEILFHIRQIKIVDPQPSIEAKWEMKDSRTSSLQRLW